MRFLLWLAAPLMAITSGCVHIYQPMSGLHRPAVVDPTARNLEDVRLTVRCIPGENLNRYQASTLCQRVGALFENQGAEVRTATTPRGAADDSLRGSEEDPEAPLPRTDLTMELRSRETHASGHPISWILNIVSFTLVPAVTESTFTHEVTLRDGTGFLLSKDTLEGRLIRYFGAGTWVGHKFLDVALRDKADRLSGDAANQHLSDDLYQQLSQIVFNAKMQHQVLQEANPPRSEASAWN